MMEEQKVVLDKGGSMRLGAFACSLVKNSKVYSIYAKDLIYERHRHRFEFNNHYKQEFEAKGMSVVGFNPETNLGEIIELKNHPWYIGVQFHPEYSSTVLNPHPLFLEFVKVATQHK